MLTQEQRDSILYQAQVALGDLAYEIAKKEQVGTPCDELYERAYYITAYMQALQVNSCALTDLEQDKIYRALRNLTQKFEYPIAPSIANPVTFPSIVLSPVACCSAGTGGGGGPGVDQEVYQYDDIAARDADTINRTSPALAFVRNAQADPLIGTVSWAFYYLLNDGVNPNFWVLTSVEPSTLYQSQFGDALTVPQDVGGIEAGTTVAELKDRTFSYLFDELLFPTILASIQTNFSASLTQSQLPLIVEAGTVISPNLVATFDPGQILNGIGTLGPALKGNANRYEYFQNNVSIGVDVTGNNTDNFQVVNEPVPLGTLTWKVDIQYDAGTSAYFDSKGNPGTNLDAQRVAGVISATATIVRGVLQAFFGTGVNPVNSAQVRNLSGSKLLSASSTGTFTLFIAQGENQLAFAVPAGKTVVALFRESSNADVTSSFTKTTFNVNDAGGNPQSYDVYFSQLAVTGYPQDSNYDITVS